MPPHPDTAAASQGLVLVVEDEFLIALDLGSTLERHGWRVLGPAATVAEALDLLAANELPDLALLDVDLRGELVLPVARWLAKRCVPFVLTSGHERAQELDRTLAGTPNLGKPTDEALLLATITQMAQARWA